MARPTKTLQEHLRDGSFRADRHAGLLLGPLVDDPDLAGLQTTYRSAASTNEQRLVAIAFAQEAKLHEGRKPRPILNGRDGAAVADFFAAHFVHTKGPAAGRSFELEDWQRAFVDESTSATLRDGAFIASASSASHAGMGRALSSVPQAAPFSRVCHCNVTHVVRRSLRNPRPGR